MENVICALWDILACDPGERGRGMKRGGVTNFSYRSGVETDWRCPRGGYLEQFYLKTGIVKNPQPYWLSVGTAVHIGLGEMLERSQRGGALPEDLAEASVECALAYWDTCGQSAVLTEYQFNEQRCLIEALLWAFYYHTLRVFLETYEVLWVEKEITEIVAGRPRYMMMSRPDAIVRSRETGELVVISWKTIDSVTNWRRLFFKQDLQGMMEAWYSEQFLNSLAGREEFPPNQTVSYVQTIYLVKGKRTRKDAYGEEGEGDAFADETLGDDWRQDSHLIYPYSNYDRGAQIPAPEAQAFQTLAWKYRYTKPGNSSFSTLGNAFKKTLITNTGMSVREWICALNDGGVFPSTMATEQEHPLAKTVVWEVPSYRDEGMMRSVIAQVKESERKRHRDKRVLERKARECAEYSALSNDILAAEHAQMLDKLFPQQLTSCSFPWKCQFQPVCHTEDGRAALVRLEMPKGYTPRVPHHEPEAHRDVK